jgi:O-antigen/teichoic acid export membrane protein
MLSALHKRMSSLLKIDTSYVARGGFFLGLTQVTSAIAGLISTIAFANLLPVETFGTYKYILALYAMVSIVALPGLDTSLTQAVARGFDGTYRENIRARMKYGFIGTIGSIVYATYLALQGSFVLASLIALMGLALPFFEAFSMYSSFLNGKKLFRQWAYLDILSQFGSIAVLTVTMYFSKNIILLIAAYFIPYIVVRGLATRYVMRTYVDPHAPADPTAQAYGNAMTLFQVLSRGITSIDQIVLYHFLGPAQVAVFALATALPNRMQSIYRITGALALPKFAERSSQEVAASLPRKMLLFAFLILTGGIAYALIAPYLFTYIFPQYLPSVSYSQIAVFYTLSAITYPFAAFLNAHKRVRENYTIALVSFVAKVVTLYICVPLYGIWGAVAGLLSTSLATIITVSILLIKERSS